MLKYRLYTHSLSLVTFESCRADPCCSPSANIQDKSATQIHNLTRTSKAMPSSSLPGFFDIAQRKSRSINKMRANRLRANLLMLIHFIAIVWF